MGLPVKFMTSHVGNAAQAFVSEYATSKIRASGAVVVALEAGCKAAVMEAAVCEDVSASTYLAAVLLCR